MAEKVEPNTIPDYPFLEQAFAKGTGECRMGCWECGIQYVFMHFLSIRFPLSPKPMGEARRAWALLSRISRLGARRLATRVRARFEGAEEGKHRVTKDTEANGQVKKLVAQWGEVGRPAPSAVGSVPYFPSISAD